ncbi:MAG TPA: SDR family NAD(P)-dependent oxidoreductase [Gammaproteobacteria bacterium]
MANILITGSNRGLGLELVRQYAGSGWRVFATCRHPSEAAELHQLAVMTSHMGSIADIQMPGSYYYRSSKAALNAAMSGLAEVLRERRIGVLLLHPGGVKTRMGPGDGISAEKSVTGLRQVIEDFTLDKTRHFIKYDGSPMPW